MQKHVKMQGGFEFFLYHGWHEDFAPSCK